MSDLPNGWAETAVNALAESRSGNSKLIKGTLLKEPTENSYPAFSASGQDVWVDHAEHEGEAIIVSAVGARCGKAFLASGQWSAVANTHIIFPHHDLVDQRWLWFRLNDENFWVRGGSAQPFVKVTKSLETVIPLPPLPEQRRIVAKVDGLTARTARARKELNRIPTLIARYKQRLLALAFSGELTAGWRAAKGLSDAKEVALVDVAKGFSYGTSAKSAPSGEVPVLRMGNIQDGKLDWTNLVFTSDKAEIKKYTLIPGDVLFNRTNSPELVGKTALYKGEQDAVYAGYLIRIQCTEKLMPEYLTYSLNGPAGRDYCWAVKTDGVSQSNINAKKIAVFRFLLPSLEEQAEIVRRIESAFGWLDRMAADHAAAARLLPKLDAAILAKAFAGNLVPQDPSDEPAGVLLERIKAEREAAPKLKHGRKSRDSASPKDLKTMAKNLEQVLTEAGDWISAQDAFQQCGIGGAATTEEIEKIYGELRKLDKAGKLEAEPVNDDQGRKLHDRLRLKVA